MPATLQCPNLSLIYFGLDKRVLSQPWQKYTGHPSWQKDWEKGGRQTFSQACGGCGDSPQNAGPLWWPADWFWILWIHKTSASAPWQKGVALTKDQELQEVLTKDFLGKRPPWQKDLAMVTFLKGRPLTKGGSPEACHHDRTLKVAAGWCAGCGLGDPKMFFGL